MSLRFFEGEDHAKVYVQYRPTPPDSVIQRTVSYLHEKYAEPLNLAVDLGCGNGQCTFAVAKHFPSVLGTDISPAQITEATKLCSQMKCENVKFQVSPAEVIPVADKSVQLITICTAAHWMDLPKVYKEASRVLVKNGVFAIIGYRLPVYVPLDAKDKGKSDAINKVLDKAIDVTKEHWTKEHWMCLHEYPDIQIPFEDFSRESGFPHKRRVKIADILGCVRSYSPFVSFCKKEGNQAGAQVLDGIGNEITSILNEGREKELTPDEIKAYEFEETFNYFVLLSRA